MMNEISDAVVERALIAQGKARRAAGGKLRPGTSDSDVSPLLEVDMAGMRAALESFMQDTIPIVTSESFLLYEDLNK